MPGQTLNTGGKPYLRIAGGIFSQTVDKGTKDAKFREWELKNGTKGSKWELRFLNWTGKVQDITFKDSEYGETCMIELDDAVLCFNVDTRYFADMAGKLCGADLKEPITFHPYDFEIDGKRKTGVSIQQNGNKLTSAFYDGKTNINGFPEVNEEQKAKLKKNYWKIYFAEVGAFLSEELRKLEIPKVDNVPLKTGVEAEDTTVAEDLPWEDPKTDLPY